MDDILQFLQSVWSNLGHVIHDNHRVYSICLLWLIFQDVTKQFCKDSTDRKLRHCSHHEGGKAKMKRTERVKKTERLQIPRNYKNLRSLVMNEGSVRKTSEVNAQHPNSTSSLSDRIMWFHGKL